MRMKFCLTVAAAVVAAFSLFSVPAAQAEQRVTVTITSLSQGRCLTGTILSANYKPTLRPCEGLSTQRWDMIIESVSDVMTVRFQNVGWGTCMGIVNTLVRSVSCAAVDSQRWLRNPNATATEYWPIPSGDNANWNQCLHAYSADEVMSIRCTGGSVQDWRITPV